MPSQANPQASGGAVALNAAAAELIAELLDVLTRRNLRLTCRFLHESLGNCFTATKFHADSTLTLKQDAGSVFPKMHTLTITARSQSELEHAAERLAASCPALLRRVKTLHLEIDVWSADAVHRLAAKCSNLQELHVNFSDDLLATFRGAGATMALQHAHLRQQLAATAPSPTLLYPPSWAARDCLQELTLSSYTSAQWNPSHPRTASLLHPANPFSSDTEPDNSCLLRALPYLTALTKLDVILAVPDDFVRDCEDVQALQVALPLLTQLRHLTIDFHDPDCIYSCYQAPSDCWAALTNLTHLAVQMLHVQLSCLTGLRQLQHLHVAMASGDASQLHTLTALTTLCVGPGFMRDPPTNAATSSITTGLPHEWRSGLKELAWIHMAQLDVAALALLTGLTRLELCWQLASPELARAIAALPSLECLQSSDTEPADCLTQLVPPPAADRPVLQSLTSLTELYGLSREMSLLQVLATWTRLPSCKHRLHLDVDEESGGNFFPPLHQLRHWSPCWLRAVLRPEVDGPSMSHPRFLFLNEQDVNTFCDAAPVTLKCNSLSVYIGAQLPPAAFQRLATTAARLHSSWRLDGFHIPADVSTDASVLLCGTEDQLIDQLIRLPLTRAHVQSLLPGSLGSTCELNVDCKQLDAAAMRVLLAAAPSLR